VPLALVDAPPVLDVLLALVLVFPPVAELPDPLPL
jgi:hypothetical protein